MMSEFPNENAAVEGSSDPFVEPEVLTKEQRKGLESIPGVLGLGYGANPDGTPTIFVYCQNSDVPDQVPNELSGVSISKVVTGDIDAQ